MRKWGSCCNRNGPSEESGKLTASPGPSSPEVRVNKSNDPGSTTVYHDDSTPSEVVHRGELDPDPDGMLTKLQVERRMNQVREGLTKAGFSVEVSKDDRWQFTLRAPGGLNRAILDFDDMGQTVLEGSLWTEDHTPPADIVAWVSRAFPPRQ